MCCCATTCVIDPDDAEVSGVLDAVRRVLAEKGIDLDVCCQPSPEGSESGSPKVKVVCVAPSMCDSVAEMGGVPRDQVVMVRLDGPSAGQLDAWVETGAVRSRSEAAALFIREGLKVRASELERLEDALSGVRDAKARLKREAGQVFAKR